MPLGGDDQTLDAEKAEARKSAAAARKAARESAGPDAAAQIARHLMSVIDTAFGQSDGSLTVSGFLPIGSEIDVRPALDAALAAGHDICLPCVLAPGEPLTFRRWREGDPLVREAFGTKAPAPDAPVVKPDILLVPMLAFDGAGYRLGYGGGFYDRSLEALRREKQVLAVGAAFAGQRADSVPRGPYDQPLDWVITELGATRFAPGELA